MDGRELERAEEEEYLLPPAKSISQLNAEKPSPPASRPKPSICKLPWFGSWSATLLIWVVGTNALIFCSLPSSTFMGKLKVATQLWSVNQIYAEDEALKSKLKETEDKNAELQRGMEGLDGVKSKMGEAQSESARLRTQLKEVQTQLETTRDQVAKLRTELAEQRRKAETSDAELSRLRTRMSDSDRSTSELRTAKAEAEKARDEARHRADHLAAKMKQLRDAELPLFKDVEIDLKP